MLTGKRVLCAASPNAGHAIPATALALEFQRAGNDVAVVTDRGFLKPFYQRLGLRCIDIGADRSTAYEALATMLDILRDFDPDITIADWRRDLWVAQHVDRKRCSISILRCEHFLGYERRSPLLPDDHIQNMLSEDENRFLRLFGCAPPGDRRLLYRSDLIVVPSTPEMDPPPPNAARDYPESLFVYTGPLFVNLFDAAAPELRNWAAGQRLTGRAVVTVTTGTAWGRKFLLNLIGAMDRIHFSCILGIPKQDDRHEVEAIRHPNLFIAEGVPLSETASVSDAVIHHCGQGTYQTVILAGKPSITIPSYAYDREDNAIRLQEAGCGLHLHDGVYRDGIDVDMLNQAVSRVVNDASIAASTREASRQLSCFMRERGPAYVLAELERHNLADPRPKRRPAPRFRTSYRLPRFPAISLGAHAIRLRASRWLRLPANGPVRDQHNRAALRRR